MGGSVREAIQRFASGLAALGSRVSLDYYDKAPFKFNGKIKRVHVQYVAGLRFMVSEANRVNISVDYARGKDGDGVYFFLYRRSFLHWRERK